MARRGGDRTSGSFRTPVKFGAAGTKKRKRPKTVVLVKSQTAKKLNLRQASESDLRSAKNRERFLKGDKDNAVKVWLGERTRKGNKKLYSVPFPAGATIAQIRSFLKNTKAKSFTTPAGVTYYLK